MIIDYRDMAGDAVRVDAFRRGIEAVVRPGDVVVDAGCGLGTYAIFACRAGARKVYAIERTDIILAAKQIARDNGCGDRIEFVRGDALAVELPEKANVVITEDFSATFLDADTERLTAKFRRLLKSGGKFVPSSVSVYAAPVSCPRMYAEIDQWARSSGVAYGIDFSATREMVMNWIHRANFRPRQLAGAPKRVHRVVLAKGTRHAFDTTFRCRALKSAAVHGVGVWFEAQLAPRVRLSNAPGAPQTLWGQGLLPLAGPVRARKGELITVDLATRTSRDSGRIWWQWAAGTRSGGADGTTFRSFPASLADLAAGSREHRPGLSIEGEVTACTLRSLKRGSRIIDAARELARRFPARFGSLQDALLRAGADARQYGRRPGA